METLIIITLLAILISIFCIYHQTNPRIDAMNSQPIETKTLQGQTTQSFGEIQSSLGRLTEASRRMEKAGKGIPGLASPGHSPRRQWQRQCMAGSSPHFAPSGHWWNPLVVANGQ